jgi:hypothetical protein
MQTTEATATFNLGPGAPLQSAKKACPVPSRVFPPDLPVTDVIMSIGAGQTKATVA